MSRVYNFSAGPAVLPVEVLQEAADEMLDYRGTGMSVMEMSHRSKAFDNIIKEAEADLRKLMNIPDNYKVLFLQGGASQQFAMIPMNFMKNRKAGYILTGQWAKKAFSEAKIFGEAVELASSADKTFTYIPDCSDLPITDEEELKKMLIDLHAKGPKVMVVTRGEKGSMAYDGEKFYYGGIVPCEVVDTMGAGDSFIAGFLYAICAGKGIQEAMADGAANSSVTIAYSGAW